MRSEGAAIDGAEGREQPVRLWSEVVASPIGTILLVGRDARLCALDYEDFGDRMHRLLQLRYAAYELVPNRSRSDAAHLLERYFDGELTALEALPVEPGGTPYQRRVWQALRAIPPGETRTYGQIAALVGGTHARAVGGANALNPIAIVVPCHRVIGADASLTGYAGGMARKRWLLDHESRQGSLIPHRS